MKVRELRIGIVGCGHAARVHLARLLACPGARVVACVDPDLAAAEKLAEAAGPNVATHADHRHLLDADRPDALAIFTPHLAHYKPAADALRAGCHVFVEKPLSTNPQEAVDLVNLARARQLKLAVGHQYRLRPSLVEARRLLASGEIGTLRLVQATLAAPWLSTHGGAEHSWRFDPKVSGGGLLADAGDHLVDALLWTTGRSAIEAAAFQTRHVTGPDLVTAAALRLADDTPATLALSGLASGSLFELTWYGESGRLRATETSLEAAFGDAPPVALPLPTDESTIDGNFLDAIRDDVPLCCPGDQALDTVRLLEALARSATTGQIVRVV